MMTLLDSQMTRGTTLRGLPHERSNTWQFSAAAICSGQHSLLLSPPEVAEQVAAMPHAAAGVLAVGADGGGGIC